MDRYDLIIIGAGPAGLSAAVQAHERGLRYVLLERADHIADTVERYQRGKLVTAQPAGMPKTSGLPFTEGSRESILEGWQETRERLDLNVHLGCEIQQISKTGQGFEATSAVGDVYHADNAVIAIGVHGNLKTLGIDGADWDGVQYELSDAALIQGERIVVIGAGDSAIENALALSEQNKVAVLNRSRKIVRASDRNRREIEKRINSGRVEYLGETTPAMIEPGVLSVDGPDGRSDILCDRIVARLGSSPPRAFLESVGVTFNGEGPDASPNIDLTYETETRGLYLVGSATGFPMIKHAINQGREVVEHICGAAATSADEALVQSNMGVLAANGGTQAGLERLRDRISLFRTLTPLQLRQLFHQVKVQKAKPGEMIFDWGSYPDGVFVVGEGSATAETKSSQETAKFDYPEGAIFGEVLAISGRPSETRVIAGSEGASLIKVPKFTFLRWLSGDPRIKKEVDRRALIKTLKLHLSSSLTDEALEAIVNQAKILSFEPGEALFHEGDPPDGIHIIRKGSVTVSQNKEGREAILAYLPSGHYVGEMAIVSGENRSATVRAAVRSETVMIKSEVFKELLSGNSELQGDIERKIMARLEENEGTRASDLGVEMAEFFASFGIGDATDLLVIDEQLCIHCDNCETACAETHDGTSRLNRKAGGMIAGLHVPTSCRHCENPLCMTDCPPDAIRRTATGEVVIRDTCIGCGNCEENCPYDVIQLAPVEGQPSQGLLSWLFGIGREKTRMLKPGEGSGAAMVSNEHLHERQGEAGADRERPDGATANQIAVKCDMCVILKGGPACVRSCPTGAAMRLGPETFFNISRARSRVA